MHIAWDNVHDLPSEVIKEDHMFGDNWIAKDREYRIKYFRTFKKSGMDFSKLTALGWAYVLCIHPELSDKCSWELLNSDTSGSAWHCLLMSQPQFADKCEWRFAARWNDPKGTEWSAERWHWDTLLARHPQFADKCDWSAFMANDLEFMARTPELVDHFNFLVLNSAGWRLVLCARPEFAPKCNWELINGDDWVWILIQQPQFAQYCSWNKLDALNWGSLLHEKPQFVDLCPWNKLSGTDWGKLLAKAPEFACKCDWLKLDKKGWQWLVYTHEEFTVELKKFTKYNYEKLKEEWSDWYEEEIGIF